MADTTVTIGGDISDLQQKLRQAGAGIQSFGDLARKNVGKTDIMGQAMSFAGRLAPVAVLGMAAQEVRKFMGEMDDLADTALRLNESTETLQRVEYASTLLAGVNLDGITTSFLRLEKSIGDVEDAAATDALQRYGITAQSLMRLPLDEKLVVLAEGFQKARAEGTGYNDIVELLGKQAGNLIPLLEQSGETLRQTFAEAPVVLDYTVQKMAAMNDQIDAFLANAKNKQQQIIGTGLMFLDDLLDPNKELGDNMKEAAAAAEKAVQQQQARRDSQADAIGRQQDAANAATRAREVAKQLAEVEQLRERIGERQFATLMKQLTPALQIEAVQKRINQEKQRQAALAEQGPITEKQALESTERLLRLQEDLAAARRNQQEQAEKAADIEKEAAEKALQKAEESARLGQATLDLEKEMQALRAEASGDTDRAEALRREISIEAEKRQIMQYTGMAEAEALRLAKERQQLNEKLANAGKDDGGKINARISGGVTEARQRAQERVQASRQRSDDAITNTFGTFEGEQARLKESFASAFPAGGTTSQNPAQVQAVDNAASKLPGTDGNDQVKIELMRALLDTLKGG